MPLSNVGAVVNLIQGYVASEFSTATYNTNQGLSLFPELIQRIASRNDLTGKTLKVTSPADFDGTNDVDVSSTAAILLGFVMGTNATATEDFALLFYNTITPVEGTTLYQAMLDVPAAATKATGRVLCAVYPEPVEFATALSYSVVQNGADLDIEGTLLGTANGERIMVVYAN